MFKYIIFLAFFAILINSCSDSDNGNKPDTKTTIKIGVLIPETGSAASTGVSTKAALKLLIDNKALLGQYIQNIENIKIEPIYRDTETDPQKALSGLQTLYQQGIKLFIGPYSSAELTTLLPFAEENDLILISPSSVATSLSIQKTNVFRFIPDDNVQVSAVHKYLDDGPLSYLVGIYRDDVWGNDLATKVMAEKYLFGGFTSDAFAYDVSLNNLNTQLSLFENRYKDVWTQMSIAGVTGYLATFTEGVNILEYLATSEVFSSIEGVKLLGSSAFANNAELVANSTAAELAVNTNFLCPMFALDDATKAVWGPLETALKTSLGRQPEVYAIIACDALQILIRAYLGAENPNNIAQLRTQVKTLTNGLGISGNLELNEYNDRKVSNYDFWGVMKENSNYSWYRYATYIAADGSIVVY